MEAGTNEWSIPWPRVSLVYMAFPPFTNTVSLQEGGTVISNDVVGSLQHQRS